MNAVRDPFLVIPGTVLQADKPLGRRSVLQLGAWLVKVVPDVIDVVPTCKT